jgi:hypothetical protein
MLRERDARIALLEEKLGQVNDLHQQFVSMQHERSLDFIREKRVDRRTAFVREKLDMLTPVLMSKMLGANAPQGSGSIFGEELLRQFLKSLGPEQYRAIAATLNPEQSITLHEILDRYANREEERIKAATETEARNVAPTNAGIATEVNGAPVVTGEPTKEQEKK